MKLPPLNALRVFEVAARKGSFVAAGEDLGVTSAAVSLQVRTLENWLGKELFFRRNNQIRLTDAGEDLYRNAAQSLSEIAAFTQSVQQTSGTRPLVLGAVPSLAERWLPLVASAWKHPYPLKIVSVEDPINLERAGIDVHISYGHSHYPDHICTPLFHDAVLPMAAPEIAAKQPDLTRAKLIEIDWGASFTRAPKWSNWFAAGGQIAPEKSPSLLASGTSLALSMAEQGLGVVLGQRRLASVLLERGALVILDPREMPLQSGYFAISAHYNAKNPGVQALLKLLNSLAGQ